MKLPFHWLAWLIACLFVSLPVIGWTVLRTGARPRLPIWLLGLIGGLAAALATTQLEQVIFTPIVRQAVGPHAVRQCACTLSEDLDAVRNALTEPWSNGQAEGQINRLKTINLPLYGRAGIDLLRARMLPVSGSVQHVC